MYSFVMQDWVSLAGAAGQTVIVPDEPMWLDLQPFQDVNIWLDVREVSGGQPVMTFETAPTKDNSLFAPLLAAGTGLVASATPTIIRAPMLSATTPLARYLRWKLTGPAANWEATFRILLAANAPGL